MASSFRAGGLASSIDTNSIIESLVSLRRAPIDVLNAKQKAVDVKVSALGSLKGKLEAFETAVKDLGQSGARSLKVSQTPSAVDVVANSSALPGRFSLEVSQLAQSAKARSAAFADGGVVTGGDLQISADGETYDLAIADGSTLQEVAEALNDLGAPLSATVLNNGSGSYLVVTRTDTGFALGDVASSALQISEVSSGSLGSPLGLSITTQARNATFSVDGLPFERRSNQVTNALPGVTLTLKQLTTSEQDLVLADDSTSTKANLQKVVDAYNEVISFVQGELNVKAETDRGKTLSGDTSLRIIQSRMQSLLTREVGTGDVRTLADLGVRSGRDGSLTIDQASFDRAIQRNGGSIDDLFDGGLVASAVEMVDAFADSVDGLLTVRTQSLAAEKKRIEAQVTALEARVASYEEMLILQFTAMEKVVSSLKATGNFLTSQENAKEKS